MKQLVIIMNSGNKYIVDDMDLESNLDSNDDIMLNKFANLFEKPLSKWFFISCKNHPQQISLNINNISEFYIEEFETDEEKVNRLLSKRILTEDEFNSLLSCSGINYIEHEIIRETILGITKHKERWIKPYEINYKNTTCLIKVILKS